LKKSNSLIVSASESLTTFENLCEFYRNGKNEAVAAMQDMEEKVRVRMALASNDS
jgi:hypothetical protein